MTAVKPPMPYRMAGYAGRAIESFQLPVYSHVIYLHPRAGKNDPGEYFQGDGDYEIRVKYKVIRLCNLEGSPFLEAGVKGLIPFTPLMKPPKGMEDDAWLHRCFEAANAVSQDPVSKADYLTDVAILSGLVFDYEMNPRYSNGGDDVRIICYSTFPSTRRSTRY